MWSITGIAYLHGSYLQKWSQKSNDPWYVLLLKTVFKGYSYCSQSGVDKPLYHPSNASYWTFSDTCKLSTGVDDIKYNYQHINQCNICSNYCMYCLVYPCIAVCYLCLPLYYSVLSLFTLVLQCATFVYPYIIVCYLCLPLDYSVLPLFTLILKCATFVYPYIIVCYLCLPLDYSVLSLFTLGL